MFFNTQFYSSLSKRFLKLKTPHITNAAVFVESKQLFQKFAHTSFAKHVSYSKYSVLSKNFLKLKNPHIANAVVFVKFKLIKSYFKN